MRWHRHHWVTRLSPDLSQVPYGVEMTVANMVCCEKCGEERAVNQRWVKL